MRQAKPAMLTEVDMRVPGNGLEQTAAS